LGVVFGVHGAKYFFDRFNGSSWLLQQAPAVRSPIMGDIACLSDTACLAVGTYAPFGQTGGLLVERFDGTRWTAQQIPWPQTWPKLRSSQQMVPNVNGLACASATDCMAVGSRIALNKSSADFRTPLAVRLHGSRWTIQSTPRARKGNISANLQGVACPTSTNCIAVGGESNGYGIIERYAGGRWFLQLPAQKSNVVLDGVSCVSTHDCVATGAFRWHFNRLTPVAEEFNGSSWQRATLPRLNYDSALTDVSCSVTGCLAVGYAPFREALVERGT
jgi:hypothetical protein